MFDYHILVQYYPALLAGLGLTLVITGSVFVIGVAIGAVVCAARLTAPRRPSDSGARRVLAGLMRRTARGYVAFFRTTPEMVLVFWIYFCLPPIMSIRLSALSSGLLALSLVAGAYLSEIFRAGIESVPRGQFEAGASLGLRPFHLWRLIILPQALRRVSPPLMNYVTEILKNSTLLSAIGVYELAYRATSLGAETFRYMEFLTAIAVGFFAVIFPLSMAAGRDPGRSPRRMFNKKR